jgi:hypothetical protein
VRDKVRKRVRAKNIQREGYGKHISNKELVQFHSDLVKEVVAERKPKKPKRMD